MLDVGGIFSKIIIPLFLKELIWIFLSVKSLILSKTTTTTNLTITGEPVCRCASASTLVCAWLGQTLAVQAARAVRHGGHPYSAGVRYEAVGWGSYHSWTDNKHGPEFWGVLVLSAEFVLLLQKQLLIYWFRQLACSSCGGRRKQSWPLFSHTFSSSSFFLSTPSTFHPLRGNSRAWKFVSPNILA